MSAPSCFIWRVEVVPYDRKSGGSLCRKSPGPLYGKLGGSLCRKFGSYFRKDYRLAHYQTSAGGEIDLILYRAREVIAVEIKSTSCVDLVEAKKLEQVAEALNATRLFYVSQQNYGIRLLFGTKSEFVLSSNDVHQDHEES